MKLAVSASGGDLSAPVDARFGRCAYFIIVDSETMEFESLANSSMGAMSGAGIQTAQMIANKGTEVVLTGNCGPNAFQTLSAAGIKIVVGVTGTVREAVERFKRGELQSIPQANVQAHFGAGAGSGAVPGSPGAFSGMGGGRGMGMGGGRGMGMGAGMGGGAFPGASYQGAGPTGAYPQMNKEQELKFLKDQIKATNDQLEQITKRIKELEEESG